MQKDLRTCSGNTLYITYFIILEGNNVRYIVCWYGSTPSDNTAKLSRPISEQSNTRFWRQGLKNVVV